MDIATLQNYLMIAGAVAVGIPTLLSALVAFFMIIPGPHPEDWIQKAIPFTQKIADLIAKFSAK